MMMMGMVYFWFTGLCLCISIDRYLSEQWKQQLGTTGSLCSCIHPDMTDIYIINILYFRVGM